LGGPRPADREIDQLVGGLLDPQPLGEGGGQQQRGRGDVRSSSNAISTWSSSTCGDRMEKSASDSGS
jgi:hypothetical protein